jgi:poly(3-hydroxybutyrate) depolymerase
MVGYKFGALLHESYPDLNREYSLYFPMSLTNYSTNSKLLNSLLVVLHSFGSSAEHQIGRYQNLSEKFSIILIFPHGIQQSWNAIDCCVGFLLLFFWVAL